VVSREDANNALRVETQGTEQYGHTLDDVLLQEERQLMKEHKLEPLTDFWTQFVDALNASGTKTYLIASTLTKAPARDMHDYDDFIKLNNDIGNISIILNNQMRRHGLKDILTREEEVKMSTVNFLGATAALDVMAYFMKKYSLDEEGKPRKFETKPISNKEGLSYIRDVCRLASYGDFADEVRWFAKGFSRYKSYDIKTGKPTAAYFGLGGSNISSENTHSMIVSYPLSCREGVIKESVKKIVEKQYRPAFEQWFKGKVDKEGAWIAMRLEKGPEFMELMAEEPFMKLAYKKAMIGQINQDFVDWIERRVSPRWVEKKVMGKTVGRQWTKPEEAYATA
jgi:hypothetical protein